MAPNPELSVLIPTHQRPEKLALALDRLAAQEESPTFEVVVTINPGDPRAPVEAAIEGRPFPVELLEAAAPGVSASRNRGWRRARAPVVLFLGDDILASPRLLAEHASWHRQWPAEFVGVLGHVRWASALDVTPFMRWLERGLQFDYGRIEGTEAHAGHLYTSNVSLKRGLLQRVGGFDEEYRWGYEDIDLGYRLHPLGFRLLYNRLADAEHLHETTLDSWKRRMRITAQAEHLFVRKHPELEPVLLKRMQRAAAAPRARGWAGRFASLVPRHFPVIGPRVWRSAERRWLQALAPEFLAGWDEAEALEVGRPRARAL